MPNLPVTSVPDVPVPISHLVLGTVRFSTDNPEFWFELLDRYVSVGGNVIDTARLYGTSEIVVGNWMAQRGNRPNLILTTKGGHGTEHKLPEEDFEAIIEQELTESLGRLQTDSVDFYWLHRDNEEMPVGRILDCLNAHLQAGRIRAFGGSNWTTDRVDEANAYAGQHGLRGFSGVSNNMSLAVQPEPFYPGLITTGPEEAEWHRQTGIPLFAWSSQARGFFGRRIEPEMREQMDAIDDAVLRRMVEVYGTDDNFERLRRCEELAEKRTDCTANRVALAWLLKQPCPVLPIIGPLTMEELDDSLLAASLELSDQELDWLDLRTDPSLPVGSRSCVSFRKPRSG